MRQRNKQAPQSAEETVRDIRRATRRHFSAEEKIRIVLDGLRGEDSIAELCRKEGIAIQGDVYPSLYEMLRTRTLAEVESLAVDRTASFTSASAGFSRPINETFQVNVDATVTNYSGTEASGGLPATEGTGNEYFVASQIIGNGVFERDDLFIAGLRFADLDTSNFYVVDMSVRYPLMEDLKINPRLMLGYRTGDETDLVEYSVLPSVLFDYYLTRDFSLELEIGARWTNTMERGVEETSTDVFFTVGYRYDFYADGSAAAPSRAAPYGVGAKP